jgi:hypothetical protein
VYLRVPNYIDPTPEMSLDEIMSMTDAEIMNLVSEAEHCFGYSYNHLEKFFNHKDKN